MMTASACVMCGGQVQEAAAPPGAYDRCELTWSGWSILACSGNTEWLALSASAAERVLSVGDMTWSFDVSVARNDMEVSVCLRACVRACLPACVPALQPVCAAPCPAAFFLNLFSSSAVSFNVSMRDVMRREWT